MRIDMYTKSILTIIALCLVWIAAGGASLVTRVEAQDRTPTRVLIVGWEDSANTAYRLPPVPETLRQQPAAVPVQNP